mmetsp:Transcript_67745/g.175471  ORF Transcript_67745/g.175471 Transcript_67745/m.175471 type:complete len:221 (+) Transcript_67745:498-1160(+)
MPLLFPGWTFKLLLTQVIARPSTSTARNSRTYVPTKSIDGSFWKAKCKSCFPAGRVQFCLAPTGALPKYSQSGTVNLRALVSAFAAMNLKCWATPMPLGLMSRAVAKMVPPLKGCAKVPETTMANALALTLMWCTSSRSSLPPQTSVEIPPPSAISCSTVTVSASSTMTCVTWCVHWPQATTTQATIMQCPSHVMLRGRNLELSIDLIVRGPNKNPATSA